MTPEQIAWVAGIIEGEGCFHTKDAVDRPRITVTMTDFDVVKRLQTITGLGYLNGPYEKEGGKHKPYMTWGVRAKADVRSLCQKILPWLGNRRSAACELLLKSISERCPLNERTHCRHGHEYTEENTYVYYRPNGKLWRQCKTCRNNAWRRLYRNLPAKYAHNKASKNFSRKTPRGRPAGAVDSVPRKSLWGDSSQSPTIHPRQAKS